MSKDFWRGFSSLFIFRVVDEEDDQLKTPLISKFKIMSNEEAFRSDLNAVASDMWNGIKQIQEQHPEFKA